MVGLGETVGSFLSISKLYNFIGKPLASVASNSPIARKGLEALARMTGSWTHRGDNEVVREFVQGEIPSIEELAKERVWWR